ncbi:MAG: prepilin-type N-terminal cleavage/methylation domain-containing protein [Candidatus Tectomicrobia bacterium]|jgi:type II secretion system protein J|nr:prepilin-type N-terminal cleavage/methylation domain-containing protein [Candidatus Tectomicrobia bacterium]HEX2276971.1 prepilin-type N-terminal cleavage/methylation domain-containing protein [Candidatus Tectomicrobia bacterium]
MKSATPQTLSKRWRDAQGFTLLEVLIAIGIMATIMVILFGTYSAAVDRAARSRELSQIYHEARVLLQLLANDLRSSYVKVSIEQAQQVLQQVKINPTTFIGEDHSEADKPADKLTFSTILPVQRPDVPDTEMCRVSYSLEAVNDPPQSRALFRRVNCSLDPLATDQEHVFLLTDLAHGLDFKYYDEQGSEYLDWNSDEPQGGKRLPARVKITLLLADQHGQLRPFAMNTDIVLSR